MAQKTTEIVFPSLEDVNTFLEKHGGTYRTIREAKSWPQMVTPEEIIAEEKKYSQLFRDKLLKVSGEKRDDIMTFVNEHMRNVEGETCYDDRATTKGSGDSCENSSDSDTDVISWLEFPAMVIKLGRPDLLKICIKTGFDLDIFRADVTGKSLLQFAVSEEDLNFEIVQELLRNSNVNVVNDQGNVLSAAIQTGRTGENQWQLLKLLVENGADLGPQSILKVTPLQSYVDVSLLKEFDTKYWVQIIDLLSSKGHIEHKNIFGRTVLHACVNSVPPVICSDDEFPDSQIERISNAEQMCFKITNYLIEKGADRLTHNRCRRLWPCALSLCNPEYIYGEKND